MVASDPINLAMVLTDVNGASRGDSLGVILQRAALRGLI